MLLRWSLIISDPLGAYKLNNFCMLLANNNRSKAYLQSLIKENLVPQNVLLLKDTKNKLPEQTENDSNILDRSEQESWVFCSVTGIKFNEKESLSKTLTKNSIPFKIIGSSDPNDSKVTKMLKTLEEEYCIYSGPGGVILKSEIFSTRKTFIHAHPGELPNYKGSTTIYYSLLIKEVIDVSVISMSENLDSGNVLHAETMKFIPGSNIDYVIDPCVRAKALINYLKNPKKGESQASNGNVFYIIHPVLKHLSIIKANNH